MGGGVDFQKSPSSCLFQYPPDEGLFILDWRQFQRPKNIFYPTALPYPAFWSNIKKLKFKRSTCGKSRGGGEEKICLLAFIDCLRNTVCPQMKSVIRVCTGSGKLGKSWNFIVAFPGLESAGKWLLVLESAGNLFNSSKTVVCSVTLGVLFSTGL